jgi:hypothetical protein
MAPNTRNRAQHTDTPGAQNIGAPNPSTIEPPRPEQRTLATEDSSLGSELSFEEGDEENPTTTTQNLANTMAAAPPPGETAEIAQMRAMIAALQAQLDAMPAQRVAARETSVFEDNEDAFEPQGHAAWAEFTPFPEGNNPDYSDQARARHIDPQTFDGKAVKFERWVLEVANKLKIDSPTFRTEDARIAYVARFLEGPPSDVVQPRLRSRTRPLTSVAEVIQLLQTAYADTNLASRADQELQAMKFDWKEPISVFIAQFSAKAEEAEVAPGLLKNKLWNKLPRAIRVNTYKERRDRSTYEQFCAHVVDAAYALEPSQDEKVSRATAKTKTKNPTSSNTTATTAVTTNNNRSGHPKKLTPEDRTALMTRGACFRCRQDGHLAKDCPRYGAATSRAVNETTADMEVDVYSDDESSKE